ncbi:MAG TPA: DinB family protein [Terriglobales bacterium]|nr:DinB family protein [Terriglobales bacterium]
MANFSLDASWALLERTPAVLQALLGGMPDFWTAGNEGPETFSPYEVVGHLLHSERTDWMARARRILKDGESRAFEPFDRFAHQRESQGKPLAALLAEFAALRAANLNELRGLGLKPEDLTRRGKHPSLGPVTLQQLLAAWTAHDLTHLHQLARTLAYQYRDEVGPWERNLGVLHCTGHGGH